MEKLFCDLKTDEEKSAFFLSGRGYETGVVAYAIQNDVAMAYHRCSEYKKELEALQSQDREDAGYESGRRCGLGFAHSVVSEILRKHYHGSGVEGLNKLIQQAADVIATEMDNPSTATTGIDICQECGGDGAGGDHEDDCEYAQPRQIPEDFDEEVENNDCDYCSGTGEGMYDGQSCAVCRGKGFL